MKKLTLSILILFLGLTVTSCKKETKKDDNSAAESKEQTAKYSIEPKTITVGFTGYKTTEKVAVNGNFEKIEITSTTQGDNAVEALNGVEFSIPVSSLITGDSSRDFKLKTLLFNVMEATTSITGKLKTTEKGKGNLTINMNGVSKNVPVTYTVDGQLVKLNGVIDLINDFNATKALESLHKACFDLHKGADGESKTWSEVAINAAIYLKN